MAINNTRNDIDEVKELAKEVIYEIKNQQRDKRLHNTKLLMRNYSKLKKHINAISTEGFRDYFSEDIQDLVDIEDLHLNSLLRTKVRTTQMLSCVDIALNALEEDYDNKNKIDVYEAFYYYYIHNMNYTEVANKLYTTTSTAQRWVSEVTRKLSVLLWGVEAFGI